MGLLTIGKALDAAATTAISGYIRDHGVTQFLNTYNRVKSKYIYISFFPLLSSLTDCLKNTYYE